jgi:hypothetical protein
MRIGTQNKRNLGASETNKVFRNSINRYEDSDGLNTNNDLPSDGNQGQEMF